jgi:hypothetical protein
MSDSSSGMDGSSVSVDYLIEGTLFECVASIELLMSALLIVSALPRYASGARVVATSKRFFHGVLFLASCLNLVKSIDSQQALGRFRSKAYITIFLTNNITPMLMLAGAVLIYSIIVRVRTSFSIWRVLSQPAAPPAVRCTERDLAHSFILFVSVISFVVSFFVRFFFLQDVQYRINKSTTPLVLPGLLTFVSFTNFFFINLMTALAVVRLKQLYYLFILYYLIAAFSFLLLIADVSVYNVRALVLKHQVSDRNSTFSMTTGTAAGGATGTVNGNGTAVATAAGVVSHSASIRTVKVRAAERSLYPLYGLVVFLNVMLFLVIAALGYQAGQIRSLGYEDNAPDRADPSSWKLDVFAWVHCIAIAIFIWWSWVPLVVLHPLLRRIGLIKSLEGVATLAANAQDSGVQVVVHESKEGSGGGGALQHTHTHHHHSTMQQPINRTSTMATLNGHLGMLDSDRDRGERQAARAGNGRQSGPLFVAPRHPAGNESLQQANTGDTMRHSGARNSARHSGSHVGTLYQIASASVLGTGTGGGGGGGGGGGSSRHSPRVAPSSNSVLNTPLQHPSSTLAHFASNATTLVLPIGADSILADLPLSPVVASSGGGADELAMARNGSPMPVTPVIIHLGSGALANAALQQRHSSTAPSQSQQQQGGGSNSPVPGTAPSFGGGSGGGGGGGGGGMLTPASEYRVRGMARHSNDVAEHSFSREGDEAGGLQSRDPTAGGAVAGGAGGMFSAAAQGSAVYGSGTGSSSHSKTNNAQGSGAGFPGSAFTRNPSSSSSTASVSAKRGTLGGAAATQQQLQQPLLPHEVELHSSSSSSAIHLRLAAAAEVVAPLRKESGGSSSSSSQRLVAPNGNNGGGTSSMRNNNNNSSAGEPSRPGSSGRGPMGSRGSGPPLTVQSY